MARTGELWVLNRINELAQRCGLDPVLADVDVALVLPDIDGPDADNFYYKLTSMSGLEEDEVQKKLDKFHSLLGIEGDEGRAESLEELNERIEKALAMTPRGRAR